MQRKRVRKNNLTLGTYFYFFDNQETIKLTKFALSIKRKIDNKNAISFYYCYYIEIFFNKILIIKKN